MENGTSFLMQLNQRPPVRMLRGKGSWLWDDHGKRYLDFIQGWAVNCLGHSPDVLTQALTEQLSRVVNVGPAYFNEPALSLAAKLARASGMDRVFLASSGAEANEAAVKLARKWGVKHKRGAYEVITTLDSFHGRTLAMSSATGKAGFDRAFPPSVEGFRKVPFGDVEALRRTIGTKTVAIMVEPIQGEAGAVVPPADYLACVRALCDEHGLLLIVDEVQTGMARTGPMFAHRGDGVFADIMSLGKGLAGGLPVSAMLAREHAACFDLGDHGGTFSGHALLCAGANAIFDVLDSPEHGALRQTSSRLLEAALGDLARKAGGTLRGRGHLWAIVLPDDRAQEVREQAFQAGLLVNAARPNVLRFMPALDVEAERIEEMRQILHALL